MPLKINLRHLDDKEVELVGEIPVAAMELDQLDELIHASNPVHYQLVAQKMNDQVLVRGHVSLVLECECSRCLKPFKLTVDLPQWACCLALEGEEKVEVVNDCLDLTPWIREDILLEFPQHPLCESECAGLPFRTDETEKKGASQTREVSAWSELNKLKFE
jgi:uncharacterized protein